MRVGVICALALFVSMTAPASAGCQRPGPAPVVPYGSSATEADMKVAHSAVQGYVNALEAYQACLDKLAASATPDTEEELKIAWRAQSDAAIDEAQSVAAVFHQALESFKASHPKSK